MLRIFAAGIATETNTFSDLPTALSDFSICRGRDVLAGRAVVPGLNLAQSWGRQAEARGDTFIFSLMAWAQPSGVTLSSAYLALRSDVLADLRAVTPVDIVLLNLHGAMVAEGVEDCEEDLVTLVRAIVGPQTVIAVMLDLHCHLRLSFIELADLVVTYKEYPHTDINDRAAELFDLAVATREGRVRPQMALFDCQMVGLYPTSRAPLSEFVAEMRAAERRPAMLSLSLAHGFPFGDVPHMGAKVLAIADGDPRLALSVADEFGRKIHALRWTIGFEAIATPMEETLRAALSSAALPVVVADQSDNVGAGAPGDSTFVLRWLLEHAVDSAALAIMIDPEVVKIAIKAGVGARLRVRLGGKISVHSGQPLDLEVEVRVLSRSYLHYFPQQSGEPAAYPLGDVAALHCRGIDIIVASERCQCLAPSIFNDHGVDVARVRLLVAKSFQHFHSAFAPVAARILYMATPGAVPPDPRQIAYHRFRTDNVFPWTEEPILTCATAPQVLR